MRADVPSANKTKQLKYHFDVLKLKKKNLSEDDKALESSRKICLYDTMRAFFGPVQKKLS